MEEISDGAAMEIPMVISPKRRYAFVSTVKGGTNSIYEVLVRDYDGVRYGDFHCTDVSQVPVDWFLFTTCRNPFDRAVSVWWSTCMRGKDRYAFRQMCSDPDSFEVFAEWAAQIQPHLDQLSEPQQQLLMTQSARHGDINFDRILRMETLEEEFKTLPFIAAHPEKPFTGLPRMNPTVNQRQNSHQYLTPRAIEAVINWMAPDFERYGYSKTIEQEV